MYTLWLRGMLLCKIVLSCIQEGNCTIYYEGVYSTYQWTPLWLIAGQGSHPSHDELPVLYFMCSVDVQTNFPK